MREISFKNYLLSTRQIIHLHMHCLGLQVSVNTVSKILKNKHNSLQCLLFQQTITMQISKQPVDLTVSDHTYPPFFKMCTLPYSKNFAVVQTLRNRFRPSTRIFYPIKRAKFSHPDLLEVTLIAIFRYKITN